MEQLTVFNNDDFGSVRTILINNEVYFVGKDITKALGYKDLNHAILDHVDEQDRLNSKSLTQGQNALELGQRGGWLVNESGFYSLALSSNLESAKTFKHWVTSEVLPSLRSKGSYTVEQVDSVKEGYLKLDNARFMREMALEYADNETYKQILDAYALKEIAGDFILPLPVTQKTYSATEIGEMLGISARKVGAIANAHDIKCDSYGTWVFDKAPNGKQVQCFRYYQKAMDVIKSYL